MGIKHTKAETEIEQTRAENRDRTHEGRNWREDRRGQNAETKQTTGEGLLECDLVLAPNGSGTHWLLFHSNQAVVNQS